MSTSCSDIFISSSWLSTHLNDPDIALIDARMLTAGSTTGDMHNEYNAGHLPGAVFFDIEAFSDHQSPFPHMMPDTNVFSLEMGKLGLSEQQHFVVYDEGNLFSAPRAWWMLRTFGVNRVSILSGGLAGWKQRQFPLETGNINRPATTFHAHLNATKIRQCDEVLAISRDHSEQIVDARSASRFNGEANEPRAGLRCGHIPGSLNVPWTELVADGALKPAEELTAIFHQHGVDIQRPVIASCGSGVTAAVVVLALTALNARQVSLYDGSWSEWGARDDLPVTTRT
ncbi:3-mercaptopyruvate sulfurtransferase [Pectobacteriaceae bacterium C52]|nr:3-mercaptopyruvate sulfurtransferase [Pectobacteriaceae bacterium C52]